MLVVPLGVIAIDFRALSSYGTRLQTLQLSLLTKFALDQTLTIDFLRKKIDSE